MTIAVAVGASLPPSDTNPAASVVPSASPWTYQNTGLRYQAIYVLGGTATLVEYSKNGTVWVDVGLLAGTYIVGPGSYLKITYAIIPTRVTICTL
jgi:hypothetical protein